MEVKEGGERGRRSSRKKGREKVKARGVEGGLKMPMEFQPAFFFSFLAFFFSFLAFFFPLIFICLVVFFSSSCLQLQFWDFDDFFLHFYTEAERGRKWGIEEKGEFFFFFFMWFRGEWRKISFLCVSIVSLVRILFSNSYIINVFGDLINDLISNRYYFHWNCH